MWIKRIAFISVMLLTTVLMASSPLLQGRLNVLSFVEWTPGISYQVSGKFEDRSTIGFTAYSITNGNLIFTEHSQGVDCWFITNVEYADSSSVTVDVAYAESGASAVGMVAGIAALCSLSTNSVGFPQQPSPEYIDVSENMLSQIRNYALRRIPASGGSGTLTNEVLWIAASNTVVYTNDLRLTNARPPNVVGINSNQTLSDTNGVLSLDWQNRQVNDSSGRLAAGWNNRCLYSSDGYDTILWENKLLRSLGSTAIDWGSRTLNGTNGSPVLYWGDGITASQVGAVATSTFFFVDAGGISSEYHVTTGGKTNWFGDAW